MSYRSYAANFIAASSKTKRYTVKLENGRIGKIAAADDKDAKIEASKWAKVNKSQVTEIKRLD